MTARKFTVRVDPELCVGNAMCRATAPNTFVQDSNGQSTVADPHGESLETILTAAMYCPVGAVIVEDAETKESLI